MFGIKVRSPFKKSKSAKANAGEAAEKDNSTSAAIPAQSDATEAPMTVATPPVAPISNKIEPNKEEKPPVAMDGPVALDKPYVLPKDVLSWQRDDVLHWLRTIFDDSESLPM
jgi:hypothetical protein